MIPGMMVRPWTSTTRAPLGFFTLAAGPTATILSPFTTMTLFATAGRPVPSMSRAPSNTVVWDSSARAADDVTQASANSRAFFMSLSVGATWAPRRQIALQGLGNRVRREARGRDGVRGLSTPKRAFRYGCRSIKETVNDDR